MSNRDGDYEIPRKKKTRKVRPDGADISSLNHISGADGTSETLKKGKGNPSKAVKKRPQSDGPKKPQADGPKRPQSDGSKKPQSGGSPAGDSIERRKNRDKAADRADGSGKKKVQGEKSSSAEGQKRRRKGEALEDPAKQRKSEDLADKPAKRRKSKDLNDTPSKQTQSGVRGEASKDYSEESQDRIGRRKRRGENWMEDNDDYKEDKMEKNSKKKKGAKIALIALGSIIGLLVLVYAGFAVYFSSHFLFFTEINGTDFSFKDVEQVEDYMKKQVSDYTLTLEESDGGKEQISGNDISIEYIAGEQLEKIMEDQDNLLWPKSIWEHPKIESKIGVKYDEAALAGVVANLKCKNPENQTPPVDARPEFQEGQFGVVPEVVGTQINTEVFNAKIAEAINGFQPTLNLSEAGCYVMPRFVSDSPEVLAAKDAMNSYLRANITYDFNPNTEVVDASVISQWVRVDGDMNVTFDEGQVRAYVQSLADKYNTKGRPRSFTTATGNVVTVEGGSYGWLIDQEAEYNALIANIQNGETVTREANYASRAASHGGSDVGSTYAEVDLSAQHIYFIQNGQVVLQSGCVTGNPNKGNATPQGVYSLAYKALDQTLRGTKKPDGTYEYETPVKYWMPFNGGIGFHDATWQPAFGGNLYQTRGSHGCVNLPYDIAGQLYNLISAGVPVVCHY